MKTVSKILLALFVSFLVTQAVVGFIQPTDCVCEYVEDMDNKECIKKTAEQDFCMHKEFHFFAIETGSNIIKQKQTPSEYSVIMSIPSPPPDFS